MPKMTSTTNKTYLLRNLEMLKILSVSKQSKTTAEIINALEQRFDKDGIPSIRQIQRDLSWLEDNYSNLLESEGERPKRWKLCSNPLAQEMDLNTALAFLLIEKYVKDLLPISTIHYLSPYFKEYKSILDKTYPVPQKQKIAKWSEKIAMIPRSIQFISPETDPFIQKIMLISLFENKKVRLVYKGKENNFSPLGFVIRGEMTYFIGLFNDYSDYRQVTLNRIKKVEITNKTFTPPPDFKLEQYIAKGKFQFPAEGEKMIQFQAYFDKKVIKSVTELSLSTDQIISKDNERYLLQANVQNTEQFFWWILGFGDKIEVIKPIFLRNKIIRVIQKMNQTYQKN
jgi:predicted DNA-binding transcriptional regulator YafY